MNYRYPFTNAIVFALVMKDSNLCKGLLQMIFPDREIQEVRQHETCLETEHSVIVGIESRKVRLDVLFKDNQAWYDIEMQVRDEKNLPKRSRYAHAVLDVDDLKPGEDFNSLKPSYVIFLCCFDPFEQGLPVYSFRMLEEKIHLSLEDETYTIILNSRADEERTPNSLKALFRYMNERIVSEDSDLLKQIDHSVESWNTGEGVRVIMTLEQEIRIKETRAREEGFQAGREEEQKLNAQLNKERIQRMSSAGLSVETIAEYMGLDQDYVESQLK